MYSKNNICIIPTYACNAACPFCYAKNLHNKFSNDMSWEVFKDVVDCCLENEKNEISFLGGEPTIWPHINNAVAYLKKNNIQVSFFSNGITYSEPPADCVLINIYNCFNDSIRQKIKESIEFYKASGTEVSLRYNLVQSSSNAEDDRFFEFSMPLAAHVSISPTIPYVPDRKLGKRIFHLVNKLHQKGVDVKVSRAIPICLFDSKQFKYLREKCFMRKKCYSEKNVVINPDGETVFPCVSIAKFEKKLSQEGFKKINDDYNEFFKCLGRTFPFSRCKECKHALNNECQAGCLAMRSSDAMEDIIKLVQEKYDG